MLIKQKALCKKIGVTLQTLNIYLCREEFSHIKRIRSKTLSFEGVRLSDIKRLKELTTIRYNKRDIEKQKPR